MVRIHMANKKYKEVSKPFKWKHAVGDIIIWGTVAKKYFWPIVFPQWI